MDVSGQTGATSAEPQGRTKGQVTTHTELHPSVPCLHQLTEMLSWESISLQSPLLTGGVSGTCDSGF